MAYKGKYPGSLTASQFEAAAHVLGDPSVRNWSRARSVLVDGKTVREVAQSADVGRELVGKAVKRVYDEAHT